MNHNPPALGHIGTWLLRDYLVTARSCAARGCVLCRSDATVYAIELQRRDALERERRCLAERELRRTP